MKKELMAKQSKRVLACLLALVMFFTSCEWPTNVYAEETQNTAVDLTDDKEEAQLVGELEGLRGESSKQFLMDDGTVSLVQYDTDVHYQDENNVWQEIDNSLTKRGAEDDADVPGYANKEGRVRFKFAQNANANFLVRIIQGKYHIFFSAENTQKEAEGARVLESTAERGMKNASLEKQIEVENVRSGIIYENIFPETDVEYITSGSSLKENIIVKKKQDSYEYTFEIKTNHINIRSEEDGSISFLKEDTGELLYTIPAMYMWDAEGRESDAVDVEISTENKKSTLTIRANTEWINAEERAFPVTIDPTLQASSTSTGSEARIVRNMYAAQGNPTAYTSGYGRGFLGYDGSSDKTYRLFVQFKTLPTIPESSVIAGAKFYYAHEDYDHVGMSELTIAAKEVTSNWAWGGRVTWNSQPSFSSTVLDYKTLSANTIGTYVGWDITKLIKNHYENKDNTTNATSAFVLVGTEEGSYAYNHLAKANVIQENSAGFFSNAQPVLVIAYRDTRGLEDYYTYQVQGLGKAGTGYVGDYTKELTLIRPIFQTNNSAMPFQLDLVYNSSLEDKYFGSSGGLNTKNYSNMKLGFGWKLNIQETVIEKTISGKKHLIYNDSDGTDHYFPLDSGSTYKDEDGLKLTIVKSSSPVKYTMTDEKGNQKIFHNGFLSTIMDANGNAVHLLYNNAEYSASGAWYANTGSTNRVTKIVQINKGQSSPKVIATFDYKNTTFVHDITDYAGRVYSLNYTQTTGTDAYNMTKIVDPDNTYARYDYYLVNSHKINKLSCTYDSETKLGVRYTYKVTKHASKLSGIGEICWTSDTAYTQGKTVDITSTEPLQVYYRDRGLDCTADTKDDIWTYYTFDNVGHTVSQISMDSSRKNYYGASATSYSGNTGTTNAHKILSNVATGVGGINLLRNGSLELITNAKANGWTDAKTISADTQSQMTMAFDGNGAVRTGTKSFRVTTGEGALPDSTGNLKASLTTTATLESGVTYTFSGYFHNTAAESFNNKSKAYLQVLDSSGTQVAVSSMINECTSEQIENGWTRIAVTFTPSAAGTYTLAGCTDWIYGTSSFDDLQLEKGSAASSYNYLVNGDVEWTDGWSFSAGASRAASTAIHGSYAVKIVGDMKTKRTASITVPLNISSDTTLVLSGWAKATSVADITKDTSSKRAFGLEAVLTYGDNTTETHYVSFDGSSSHLQYTSLNIVPKKTGSTIKNAVIRCVYGKNANTAYFDNISLKKEPVACYKYDSNGNVVAVNATDVDQVNFTYSAGNLIKTQSEGNGIYNYTYDDKHNLTKVSNDGVDMTLTYDAMGHVKTTKLQNTSDSENKTISTSAEYSENGEYLVSQTDALGATTSYTINTLGLTESVTDPLNHRTFYDYNADNDRLESVSLDNGTSVSYAYSAGVLDSITRNCLLQDEGMEQEQEYRFLYDVYDNVTAVKVGDRTLVSYEYMAKNGPLTKITYGNGFCIEYGLDVLGRVVTEKQDDILKYHYVYESEGALSRQEELDADGTVIKAVCYEYDSLGRLIRSWEEVLENGMLVRKHSTEHIYDSSNRLSSQSWKITGSDSASESYTYNSDDGTLSSMTTASEDTLSYTYDYLKRLQGRSDGERRVSYEYQDVGDNGTSTQVSEMTWSGIGEGTLSLSYSYDSLGNITEVKKNGVRVAIYAYDEQSQLIYERLPQQDLDYGYDYDEAGNIRNIGTFVNGNLKITYFNYEDEGWGDLLTSSCSNRFTYDAIGNPLKYYSGFGPEWTFTWKNGRKLASAQNESLGVDVTYDYDSDGMRTSKTVDGVTHHFRYIGGLLMEERWGSNKLEFTYDEQSRPYSVKYNGELYYYILNLQGDVICIVDEDGEIQTEYIYSAYGRIVDVSGNSEIGSVNPLTYRGYYYDAETGFYYVSSRYYDPEVGRFLNADSVIDNRGVITQNLFAYCGNNPVNNADPTGHAFGAIVGGIVGGILGGLTAAASGKSILVGAATGAFTGALIGGICDGSATVVAAAAGIFAKGVAIVKTMVACATVAAGGNVLNQVLNYSIESRQYNKNNQNKNNSNKFKNDVSNDKSTEYESLKNYIDMDSVRNSAISAAICAPLAVGGGIIVDGVLGTSVSGLTKLSKFIAESAMGSNVSMIQTSVEYIIPIFGD